MEEDPNHYPFLEHVEDDVDILDETPLDKNVAIPSSSAIKTTQQTTLKDDPPSPARSMFEFSSPLDMLDILKSPLDLLKSVSGGSEYQIATHDGSVFDVASAQRNIDFHLLFPSLSAEERLIEDYTCAWLNDVLLHGRMYITEAHLAFYTKVIWTYTAIIPLNSITAITKKVVGGIFDNALEIETSDKKYYFTSFLSRNQAHDQFTKIIANLASNQISRRALKRTPSVMESNNRRSRSMGSVISIVPSQQLTKEEMKKSIGLAEIMPSPVDSMTDIEAIAEPLHIIHQSHPVNPMSPTDLVTKAQVECFCLNSIHKKQIVCMDAQYNISFDAAYNHLFSTASVKSGFLSILWKKLKYTDLETTDWNEGARKIEYIRPISNPIGPKQTRCKIIETLVDVGETNVCVDSVTATPDVPSGGSFQVKTRTCLMSTTKGRSRIVISCVIEYVKSTWIKSILDVAIPEGLKEYHLVLEKELRGYEDNTKEQVKIVQVDQVNSLNLEKELPVIQEEVKKFDWFIFLRETNYGVAIVVTMLLLLCFNVLGLLYILKLNNKLNLLLSKDS